MDAYWKGGHGGAWNSTSPGYNWTVANGSSTEINWLPNANTDIFFTLGSPGTTSTTLGQNTSVHSITFAATSAPMTIGGSNSLTIFDGITVASGGTATQTISCPVQLGTTQTWDIDGSGRMIVSGQISGSGSAALIKTGSGTLILSGSDSYSGGTTVADGTLILSSAAAIPTGTSLTVGAGGMFASDPAQAGAALAVAAGPAGASAVPETSTLALLLTGLAMGAGLALWRRKGTKS
jgi:autotransporter-associated beta strand protein